MEVSVEQFHTPSRAFRQSSRHHEKHSSKAATSSTFSKTKGSSKQVERLSSLYNEARDLFYLSALSKRFEVMLQAKNRPRITRVVSLGLGSLVASKDQPRRIKQLVILMAIAHHLQSSATSHSAVSIFAQDPSFTKIDEDFLGSLGIQILKTSSPSDLGEAGYTINEETLVYSPFLTIDAYGQVFGSIATESARFSGVNAPVLIGDDFNALKMKWEKRTSEHKDVDNLMKKMRAGNYQRRAINGDGFWLESDSPFPMALYWKQPVAENKSLKLKL